MSIMIELPSSCVGGIPRGDPTGCVRSRQTERSSQWDLNGTEVGQCHKAQLLAALEARAEPDPESSQFGLFGGAILGPNPEELS